MCIKFAKLGCKVVGLDISQAGLMKTEEMLGKLNLKSSWKGYKCDLSDRKAVYETASLVGWMIHVCCCCYFTIQTLMLIECYFLVMSFDGSHLDSTISRNEHK